MAQLLHCDVTIMKLANLNFALPHGELFVRYYISIGNGRRIRIDTRPIPSTSERSWEERAELECRGSENVVSEVMGARDIVFELRWRRKIGPVWPGKMVRSKLLGRGEVAMNLDGISVERWVGLGEKSGSKPLSLLVKIGVRVNVRVSDHGTEKKCNCESCGWVGSVEDMFL